MWDFTVLRRLDLRSILVVLALMGISLLVISATTVEGLDFETSSFFTPTVTTQIRWFFLGWCVYLACALTDYRKLRTWAGILYFATLVLLIGLFFVPAIQNCHRWYRIPGIPFSFQPSEYAKLSVVIVISWFLERKAARVGQGLTALQALMIVLIPFFLILKQPDLGSALVLYPIALVMFYFSGVKKTVVKAMCFFGAFALALIALLFLGVVSHESLRPYATKVLKEYQYERLNPHTYHQRAAQTAIAIGGLTGSGFRKSEFTGRHWLPEASTDSVFAAFGEEFGLVGILFLLVCFFGLIYFSFQVTAVAKDRFGKLLSAGIAVYLAVHMIVNMGMMCGILPITGVPLVLVTYGGSSVLATMTALGILQSIYSRRFMF